MSTVPISGRAGKAKPQNSFEQQILDDVRRLSTISEGVGFEQHEREVLCWANELARTLLQRTLQAKANAFGDALGVDGRVYRRHEMGTVQYHSLCGPIVVERASYREASLRNGPTVIPLDLSCGLIERSTPALAYSIAQAYARGPMRHYVAEMQAAHRDVPSRSTLERIAKEIAAGVRSVASDAEQRLRAEEVLPAAANALVIGMDRTTVPMEEPHDPKDQKRWRPRKKPYQRRKPPPISVKYRMAYVGTVAVVDDEAQALLVRRYAAAAHEGPADVLSRMMADVGRALEQRPNIPVAVVQDGASQLWGLTWDCLRALKGMRRQWWLQAIDFYHLTEHLNELLKATDLDAQKRARRLRDWKHSLLHSHGAIRRIARWLCRQIGEHDVPRRVPDGVNWRLQYIDASWMFQYAKLRERGIPTGSGITEGACKSLITSRTKRSGQRWSKRGVEGVLALRAVEQSGRLPGIWSEYAHNFHAHVQTVLH